MTKDEVKKLRMNSLESLQFLNNLSNEEKQLLLDRTFLHIWEIIRFIINSKNYVIL